MVDMTWDDVLDLINEHNRLVKAAAEAEVEYTKYLKELEHGHG
jgi:hypothetical protein